MRSSETLFSPQTRERLFNHGVVIATIGFVIHPESRWGQLALWTAAPFVADQLTKMALYDVPIAYGYGRQYLKAVTRRFTNQ